MWVDFRHIEEHKGTLNNELQEVEILIQLLEGEFSILSVNQSFVSCCLDMLEGERKRIQDRLQLLDRCLKLLQQANADAAKRLDTACEIMSQDT